MERVRESQILRNTIRDNIEAGVKLIGCDSVVVEDNDM